MKAKNLRWYSACCMVFMLILSLSAKGWNWKWEPGIVELCSIDFKKIQFCVNDYYDYVKSQYHCEKNNAGIPCNYLQYHYSSTDKHHVFSLDPKLLDDDTKIVGIVHIRNPSSNKLSYVCFEVYNDGATTTSNSSNTTDCYTALKPDQAKLDTLKLPPLAITESTSCSITYPSAPDNNRGENYIYGITQEGVLFHNTPSDEKLAGVSHSYFDIKGDGINNRALCLHSGAGCVTPTRIELPDGSHYQRYEVQLTAGELSLLTAGKLSIEYKVSHQDLQQNYHSQCLVSYGFNDVNSGHTEYFSQRGTPSDICLLGGQPASPTSTAEACVIDADDIIAGAPYSWVLPFEETPTNNTQAHFWVSASTVDSNKEGFIPAPKGVFVSDHHGNTMAELQVSDATPQKLSITTTNGQPTAVDFRLISEEWGHLYLHILPASSDAVSLTQDPLYLDNRGVLDQSIIDAHTITYKTKVVPFALDIELEQPLSTPAPLNIPPTNSADPKTYLIAANTPFSLPITPVAWQAEDDQVLDGKPDGHLTDDASIAIADLSNNPTLRTLSDEHQIEIEAFTSRGDELYLAQMASCHSDATKHKDWETTRPFSQQELTSTCFTALTKSAYTKSAYTPYFGDIRFESRLKQDTFLAIDQDLALSEWRPSTPIIPYNITATKTFLDSDRDTAAPLNNNPSTDQHFYFDEPFDFHSELQAYAWNYDDPLAITPDNKKIVQPNFRKWEKSNALITSDGSFSHELNDNDNTVTVHQPLIAVKEFPNGSTSQPLAPLEDETLTLAMTTPYGQTMTATTTANLYWGCLYLPDRSGPEDAPLEAPLAIQYWSGNRFVEANFDNATRFDSKNIQYRLLKQNDQIIDNKDWKPLTWADPSIGIGKSRIDYQAITKNDQGFYIDVEAGKSGQRLSAPGKNQTGQLQLRVNLKESMPWLHTHCTDNITDNTTEIANYEFGTYRGHDRVIYWQEVIR